MEGIFTPEIWIKVAEKTGIEELRLTTRDISDYDVLMQKRLGILKANGLKLKDITDVIQTMDPLKAPLNSWNGCGPVHRLSLFRIRMLNLPVLF